MITYHGWADQLIFPKGSIDYFNRVVAANGGLKRVREFDRLFMVPGMNHCRGGAGAVNFGQSGVVPVSLDPEHDAVLALQRWVEEGVAPDMLIATTDQPVRRTRRRTRRSLRHSRGRSAPILKRRITRALGDPTDAANFVCAGRGP